jgi:hypothetical protein
VFIAALAASSFGRPVPSSSFIDFEASSTSITAAGVAPCCGGCWAEAGGTASAASSTTAATVPTRIARK